MTVRQDIAAAPDDATKYALRVDALYARLQGVVGLVWKDRSGAIDYTLIEVVKAPLGGVPAVWLKLKRAGSFGERTDNLIFPNPPVVYEGVDIEDMSNAQFAAFGRHIIGELPPP